MNMSHGAGDMSSSPDSDPYRCVVFHQSVKSALPELIYIMKILPSPLTCMRVL